MIQKIVGVKNPILRQKAKEVTKIDKKIKDLAQDLIDTLRVQKDPEGVGLAAPQLGKSLRMFAMAWKKDYRVIINPQIINITKGLKAKRKTDTELIAGKRVKLGKGKSILEGCLSVPNIYGPLKRPQNLTLKFLDTSGQEKTEIFYGFSAQIIQHEIDHLNGILFIDKIIKSKKPLYKLDTKTDDWEEIQLV